MYPSSAPTSVPSLSRRSQYLYLLQQKLANVSVSSSYVQYSEVIFDQQFALGGCSQWQSQVSLLPLYASSGVIESINMLSSSDFGPFTTSSCTTNASIVLDLILRPPIQVVNQQCDQSTWMARTCSNGKVAVCVNCLNPCSVRCQAGTVINPCNSNCQSFSEGSDRILTFNFRKPYPAPTIVVGALSSVTQTSATVTLSLSSNGAVYVGVFATGIRPKSVDDIVQQQQRQSVATAGSVKMMITGLKAASAYDLYFYSVSADGSGLSFASVSATRTSLYTLCCRNITLSLLSRSVLAGKSLFSALSVSVDAAPFSELSVSLALVNTDLDSTSMLPPIVTLNSFNLISSSSITAASTSLVDTLTLSAVITGPDANLYSAYFPNGNTIKVIGLENGSPGPKLMSAQISSDGVFVLLQFDAPSNRAQLGNSLFQCRQVFLLFGLSGKVVAQCRWISSTTVSMSLSGSNPLNVGDLVSVAGNVLKAECPTDLNCKRWLYSLPGNVSISLPSVPLVPVVAISAPLVISSCTPLVLDLSSSSGAAGRQWTSITFAVDFVNSSVSAELSRFLNSHYSFSPPTAIPSSLLALGVFQFTATLCNFLGGCGQGSVVVSVILTQVPVVTMTTESSITIAKKVPLTIAGSAFVPSCNASAGASSNPISYSWAVTQDGLATFALRSSSRQPNIFLVPANSLSVGSFYKFTLTALVDSVNPPVSSFVSVQVFVKASAVVALISGGSSRGVLLGASSIFSGSSSYDEDNAGAGSAALRYTWSCGQMLPQLSETCSLDPVGTSNRVTFSLYAGAASINTTSLVTMTVTSDTRSSFATATVFTLPVGAPSIVIGTVSSASAFNPANSLVVPARITLQSSASFVWSTTDLSLDLAAASLSQISGTNRQGTSTNPVTVTAQLILSGNRLSSRAVYTFTLTSTSFAGTTTTSSITITTLGAPIPGTLSVTPRIGVEIETIFAYATSQWTDSALPITYAFGFLSADNVMQTIQSRSQTSFGSTTFPVGYDRNNFTLTCVLVAFNSINANQSIYNSVQVFRSTNALSSVQNLVSSKLQTVSTTNTDSVKRTLSTTASTLNFVECARAGNCTALNRSPCRTIANTCGACLRGYFGQASSSNTPCSVLSSNSRASATAVTAQPFATPKLLSSYCNMTSDCLDFQHCIGHVCTNVEQDCPNNCSSHGVCSFSNIYTGERYAACPILDTSCSAYCRCSGGYFGLDCSVSSADQLIRVRSRLSLLRSLGNLTQVENINTNSVESWINSLASIVNPSEVSSDCFAPVQTVLSTVLVQSLDVSMTEPVLDVVDAIMAFDVQVSRELSSRRLADDSKTQLLFNQILSSLPVYNDMLIHSMGSGRLPVTSIYDYFRMQAVSVPVSSDQSRLTLTVPATTTESYVGAAQLSASLDIPPASTTATVSLLMINSLVSHHSNLESNVAQLQLGRDILCPEVGCMVDFTLPNLRINASQLFDGSSEVVLTQCEFGRIKTVVHPCPFQQSETVHCDGTFSALVESTCPNVRIGPICAALLFSGELSYNVCTTREITDSHTSCRCNISQSWLTSNEFLAFQDVPLAYSQVAQFASVKGDTIIRFPPSYRFYPKRIDKSAAEDILLRLEQNVGAFIGAGVVVLLLITICVCRCRSRVVFHSASRIADEPEKIPDPIPSEVAIADINIEVPVLDATLPIIDEFGDVIPPPKGPEELLHDEFMLQDVYRNDSSLHTMINDLLGEYSTSPLSPINPQHSIRDDNTIISTKVAINDAMKALYPRMVGSDVAVSDKDSHLVKTVSLLKQAEKGSLSRIDTLYLMERFYELETQQRISGAPPIQQDPIDLNTTGSNPRALKAHALRTRGSMISDPSSYEIETPRNVTDPIQSLIRTPLKAVMGRSSVQFESEYGGNTLPQPLPQPLSLTSTTPARDVDMDVPKTHVQHSGVGSKVHSRESLLKSPEKVSRSLKTASTPTPTTNEIDVSSYSSPSGPSRQPPILSQSKPNIRTTRSSNSKLLALSATSGSASSESANPRIHATSGSIPASVSVSTPSNLITVAAPISDNRSVILPSASASRNQSHLARMSLDELMSPVPAQKTLAVTGRGQDERLKSSQKATRPTKSSTSGGAKL